MDCPICNHNDIAALAIVCPSCGSDLAQLTMIDQMEEKYVNDVKKRVSLEGELVFLKKEYEKDISKYRWRFNRLLILLFLLPLLFKVCKRKDNTIQYTKTQIDSLNYLIMQSDKEKLTLVNEINSLKASLESCNTTKVRSVNYTMKPGDRLSELGLLFFNDMKAGYQIGNDNNIWSDYTETHIDKGKVIKINFR